MVKNISVIQSLSVSQFVFFKFNGDSNLSPDQIGKNIFENSSELLSQLIEVHQIQISSRSCPKVGKIRFCIVEVEWKIFVWIRVDGSFLQLLHPSSRSPIAKCSSSRQQTFVRRKRSEDPQAETKLYSTAGDGTYSLEDWRGGELLHLYFSRWVQWNTVFIDQQRVRMKCNMSPSSIFFTNVSQGWPLCN